MPLSLREDNVLCAFCYDKHFYPGLIFSGKSKQKDRTLANKYTSLLHHGMSKTNKVFAPELL
jgi:hypothetical protein